ncbi:hypothetical protein [Oceanobacillus sp. FSL W7-1293]|uniref:hypothetical protein n=1 Tax=Oceanobacillus sp. FSL W7-1293 TaxID=2921699 RepID=UPI0030D04B00
MARKEIKGPINDQTLNNTNSNFIELYKEYIEAGLNAADARKKATRAVADSTIAKDTAETTREEMLAIIREQTQNGDLAPEIAQARGGEATLGERFNSVDSQLAQTETSLESIENANAQVVLPMKNYLGNYENIHPKVLHFKNGWNGYKYWMAYTPYPSGATQHENPCISVSNDMRKWGTPEGMTNPLAYAPNNGYNSDTHLLYRADLDRLEVWWRPVDDLNKKYYIVRSTSLNGVDWTELETIYTADSHAEDMLSPAAIFEDGKYKVWYCAGYAEGVKYAELNSSASEWLFTREDVNIDWGNLSAWHIDVIRTDKGIEMAVCAYPPGGNGSSADLYYVLQRPDGTLTKPKLMLKRSSNPNAFDSKSIYRSSLLKEGNNYYLFYSSIANDNRRALSLSYGIEPTALNGIKTIDRFETTPSSKFVYITAPAALTNYDVSNIDDIFVIGNGKVTINSLKGAYRGKKVSLIVNGSNVEIELKHGSNFYLPYQKDYYMSIKEDIVTDLICITDDGDSWRADVRHKNKEIFVRSNLNDYDVRGIDVLFSSNSLTVNSLKNGRIGQRIDFVLQSSATIIFKYSDKLITPNLQDYTLDISKVGVTLICTREGENEQWRVF